MTASDDDLIQKGQDDLIRRGDALKLMQLAIDVYGQNMRGAADKKEKRDWQSMLIAAVDIRYAIKDIPAVQVTAYSENDVEVLVEALEKLVHAVCGETGFAQSVRNCSGFAYPWPALDEAELIARAALARACLTTPLSGKSSGI